MAIVWTDAARAEVLPKRGERRLAEGDAASFFAIVRAARVVPDSAMFDDRVRPIASAIDASWEAPPATLDLETEAVRAAFATLWRAPRARIATFRDGLLPFWIARGGVEFAVRALGAVSAFEGLFSQSRDKTTLHLHAKKATPHVGMIEGNDLPWFAFRHVVCALDDRAYAIARDVAATERKSAPLSSRVGFALAFAEERWWKDDLDEAIAARSDYGMHYYAWRLLAAIDDRGAAERLIEAGASAIGGDFAFRHVYTLLDRFGEAGAPTIHRMRHLLWHDKENDARALGALAMVLNRENAATFVELLERDGRARPLATSYLIEHPALAIAALANASTGASSEAGRFLDAMVRRARAIAIDVAPSCGERARRAIDGALERTRPREEASLDELPAILRAPPWRSKRTKKRERKALLLPPIERADRIEIAPAERAAWVAAWNLEMPWMARALTADDRRLGLADGALLEILRGGPTSFSGLASIDWPRWSFEVERVLRWALATHGADAIPFFLEKARAWPNDAFPLVAYVDSPKVAPFVADALDRLKRSRATAQRWLVDHVESATIGLLPIALGKPGVGAAQAARAFRFMATRGRVGDVREVVDRFGGEARAAFEAMLAEDPLDEAPKKPPKLPSFVDLAALPRPHLADVGRALPRDALLHLVEMLAFTKLDPPYAGVAIAKASLDRGSLTGLAWALYDAWMRAGAPGKEQWAFYALAHFGDDDAARELAPKIRAWPTEGASGRAAMGLDVLAAMGTDVAWTLLHGIADRVKSKPLQKKAQEKLVQLAEAQGLTKDELEDRLVPTLGLDEDGSTTLDFGPRSFRVGFDEGLRPFVRDASGERRKDLPKPSKETTRRRPRRRSRRGRD